MKTSYFRFVHSGFFFSHIGWLLCKKHPDVREKGKGVDLSDLRADPVLKFQSKYVIAVNRCDNRCESVINVCSA